MTDNLPEALRRDADDFVVQGCAGYAARAREAADIIEGLTAMVNAPRPDMAGEGKLNGLADEPSLTMIYGAIMALRDEVRRG